MLRPLPVIAAFLLATSSCGSPATSPDVAAPDIAASDSASDQTSTDAPGSDLGSDLGPPPVDYSGAARATLAVLDQSYFEAQLAILADDTMQGRQNLSPGGLAARQHLIGQLQALGVEPAGVSGYEQPFAEGVNVVGRILGADPAVADEYVVISGHYDHLGTSNDGRGQCAAIGKDAICNGASDNASGVAAVLTIVKALKTSSAGLRRSLLVVFWDAEEDGLLGSKHFVDVEPLVGLESIAAMFSVDIVGTRIIPGVDTAFALGMDFSEGLRETLHAVNAELGTTVYPVSLNFSGGEGGRSDHKPFQEAGVPVAFFGAGSSPVYHTAADNLDAVDPVVAMMLIRHVLLATAELANGAARPVYVVGPKSHLDDARALRDLGAAILVDPAAVGLDSDVFVTVIQGWVEQLEEWIASPPQTDAEWAEYQQLVDDILTAVYSFI